MSRGYWPVPSSKEVPADVRQLADEIVRRVERDLGQPLAGAYLSGSVALGDYQPESSDLDIFAVTPLALDADARQHIVDNLLQPALEIPAQGLEFVLYERSAVAEPSSQASFEVNLNTGPRVPLHFSIDSSEEPAHWFVLDRAMVRERGLVVTGLPPSEVFAPIPRKDILENLRRSLAWHEEHDAAGFNTVLNGARALYFLRHEKWASKTDAARWVTEKVGHGDLMEAALSSRRGHAEPLDPEDIGAFIALVQAEIGEQPSRA